MIVVLAFGLAGCTVDVDYADSQFQCRRTASCPDGHDCIANTCVRRETAIDAGPSDAEVADAAPDAMAPDAMAGAAH
jgi:hypothetical protein